MLVEQFQSLGTVACYYPIRLRLIGVSLADSSVCSYANCHTNCYTNSNADRDANSDTNGNAYR